MTTHLGTKVGFIGLGKLGGPVAEHMQDSGYDVIGYDVIDVDYNIKTVDSVEKCIEDRDYIFIAVPTPHDPEYDGSLPSSHLEVKDFDYNIVVRVFKEINKYLKDQTVVLISTVLPGTIRYELKPFISGRLIYNPYLIAMGTVKYDMINPEMVILGNEDGDINDFDDLIKFYQPLISNNSRFECGTWDEAECIKIFYNTFISTKVALVNMIQDVAERNGNIDSDVVTEAIANSTNRIISKSYMKAGMGDGGPCHPRDNIALSFLAKKLDLGYDLFHSIMNAREIQAKNIAEYLKHFDRPVVILGKSFKPGVPYSDGSYSLLIGYFLDEVYYDEEPNINDPIVYLLGHRGKFNDYDFRKGSIVVDPWRECPIDTKDCFVIHYGNTREFIY